ncbi:MAG: hypothetical protein ACE5E8_07150, partial [Acidimicrobiia bacterium]
EARRKREVLHQAMIDLEAAYTAPWKADSWASNLLARLGGIERAIREHAEEVESADGVIARVLEDAPRLSTAGEILVEDHARMIDKTRQVTQLVQGLASPLDREVVGGVRDSVLELLGMISLHRQRGANMVYEAYLVDIGEM